VWTFFIPIVNLWGPFKAVQEIWQVSGPEQEGVWRRGERPGLLAVWWAAWVLSNLLATLVTRAPVNGLPAEDIRFNRMLMAVTLVEAVAGVLALLVVRGLAARQRARVVQLSSPRAWQPAAPDVSDEDAAPVRPRRRKRRRPPPE
jgi:hypothetical protein